VRTHVFELAAGVDRRRCQRALAEADVVVDAMYGTGFRGTLEGDAAWFVEQLDRFDGEVVAVDIPSGVDGLTGTVWGPVVRATRTVTFAARKPGLVFEPGRSLAGEVTVADIGIAVDGDESLGLVEASDVASWLPARAPDAHKWTSGTLVVGGSGGMTGAPMLVSHAAMRAGAGIVWCALPGVDAAHRASGGEVITKGLPADRGGFLARDAVETLLADVGRFASVALGPGLGGAGDPDLQFVVRTVVAEARPPLVLDADGLNALAGDFTSLKARGTMGAPVVLTPHAGEYQRLMGAPVGGDRLAAARALAERAGAVVLLKGPGTVVASPDGTVALNPTGGAALATAGSGDVLTGIIAGFLARGVDAFRAAAAAAWVHGRTADRLVETDGPGLVAGDLVDGLGRTLQELGANP
jgi:NAD(P)H-hydrate epimerase